MKIDKLRTWLFVVVAGTVAFVVGRCTATPDEVEEDLTVEVSLRTENERLQEKVSFLERSEGELRREYVERLAKEVADVRREVSRSVVREEIRPDGTRIVTRTEETEAEEARRTTEEVTRTDSTVETESTERVVELDRESETDRLAETTRREEYRRTRSATRLLVGLGTGVSVPGLLGGAGDRQVVPLLPDRVAGLVTVDAHLLGPVWGGAWASSSGTLGIALKWAF